MSQSIALFNDYLPFTPWWILAVMAAGGVAVFYIGNRRLDKTLQRAGLALTFLAVLLGILRFTFPSSRERMETRSRAIVKAVSSKDWNRLSSLLDQDTAIGTPQHPLRTSSGSSLSGRDLIVSIAKLSVDRWGVKDVWVTGTESQQTQTLITVSTEILSSQVTTQDRPVNSSWQFDYEQSGSDWILTKITLLRIGQESGDQLFNVFGQ